MTAGFCCSSFETPLRPRALLQLISFADEDERRTPERPLPICSCSRSRYLGAITFVWQQLPEFRQIVVNPGEQLAHDTFSDLATVGILFVMQISFWCRLLYIPIPFRRPNMILNHMFLFLGRLSFIFGSALFSIVVFRHLPELSRETDILFDDPARDRIGGLLVRAVLRQS